MSGAWKAFAAVVLILQATLCLAEFEIDEAADLTGTGLFLPPGALDPVPPPQDKDKGVASAPRKGLHFHLEGPRLPQLSGLSVAVGAAAGVLADEAIRRDVFPKLATATAHLLESKVTKAKKLVRRLRRSRERPSIDVAPEPKRHSSGHFAGLVALGFASFLLAKKRAGFAKGSTADAVATPIAKRPKSKAAPPPPPPRGKGIPKVAARPKASTADEAFLSPRSAELARFGKRIHWVKPSCEEPQQDTIFGELKMVHTQSEQERKLQFDKNLMDAMFTPRSARGAATPRKSWTGPKPQGLCLLDNSRAHNVAIVLTKLAMSTKELSRAIRLFDTGCSWLRTDHVELLTVAMPTTSEATKLLAHKDKEDALRDVERRMLPLCNLSPARIKVMKFALSYQSLRESLMERCQVLQLAAEESRNSVPFRELLAIVLEAGNYINGGDQANAQGERVRAFGIESLQSLANFKVGCISCMHFLCITMRASDRRFLSCLEDSLKHVRTASKERFNQLRSDVEAFLGEVNFAAARLREFNAAAEEPHAKAHWEGGLILGMKVSRF
ncbi:FH3 [Symbiodinium natans]|uniref:FH3 protein n=1 Tax=Symbiodinium natans TaxID=878477 RepID=A0A812TSL3_9DINO|nr:FH3 [Symbiodinium natans]